MKFFRKPALGLMAALTASICFGQTTSFSVQPIADAFVTPGASGLNNYVLGLSSGLVDDVASGSDLSLRFFAADSGISCLAASRSGSASARPDILVQAVAVPEPGTVALCGMALVLLCLLQALRRWMRGKSQR